MLLADDINAGQASAAPQQAKDYYPYIILHKITSFFHYFSSFSDMNNQPYLQDQKLVTAIVKEKGRIKEPFLKRILIVDDEPDVTLTFKVGLEGYHYGNRDDKNKIWSKRIQ